MKKWYLLSGQSMKKEYSLGWMGMRGGFSSGNTQLSTFSCCKNAWISIRKVYGQHIPRFLRKAGYYSEKRACYRNCGFSTIKYEGRKGIGSWRGRQIPMKKT